MEKFVIEGGYRLKGSVTPSGNKNAALPIIAATLLTDEEVVVSNVPDIRDVRTMLELLADAGAEIRSLGDHRYSIRTTRIKKTELNANLCAQMRASILLAGPMLSRCGQVRLPPPGGDVIGRRRIDTHILALEGLGAQIEIDHGYIMETRKLVGTSLFLDEASVTATENAIMAACLAEGKTVIRNAASEPHVQDLAQFLNYLGARVSGIGTNTLTIEGVKSLHGGEYRIGTDLIEVGSLMGLAAVTHSDLLIKNAEPQHLPMIRLVFERLGVRTEIHGQDILVPAEQDMRIVHDVHGVIPKIDDGPWPAFPADLVSVATVVATQCEGAILIFEKMYESRMFFVDKLFSMGARIILCDPHRAVVVGPSKLHGEQLESPDIRAGMALLIATLCAEGQSVIRNIGQIDRGYERIEEKLQALGAKIERVRE